MGHRRERYNAKARSSTAGGTRKSKKTYDKDDAVREATVQADPNASMIVSKPQAEKRADKERERIRNELDLKTDAKMSSKKKRRLEKYIGKKLSKEERVVLLEKLAQSQSMVNSFALRPSASLGSGVLLTHAEKRAKQEDKETKKLFDRASGSVSGFVGKKRKRTTGTAWTAASSSSSSSEDGDGDEDNNEIHVRKGNETHDVEEDHWPEWSGFSTGPWEEGIEDNINATSSSQSDDAPENYHNNDTDASSSGAVTDENEDHPKRKRRRVATGFKDWAMQQLIAARHPDLHQTIDNNTTSIPAAPQPQPPQNPQPKSQNAISGPLGEVFTIPCTPLLHNLKEQKSTAPLTRHVVVNRKEEIQEARMQLPVVAEEQPIMEAILLNPVVVICGETGCGKTTQIPQFLYEAGFGSSDSENPGLIGITQPRRVAAMSMASRVATELNLTSIHVSYQIRYDATVSPSTIIKFMTDGILLRELAGDFLLSKYSVIIVDEAHERSMNTDILIGVLSRVVRLREQMWKDGENGIKPLRLIIMSATLRVTDFTSNRTLFSTSPPVINIPVRQHPVTIHFSRKTVSDYVSEAFRKTAKIHTRLPPGGILVFLTGQNEIVSFCRKLEAAFGEKSIKDRISRRQNINAAARKRMEELERKSHMHTLSFTHVDIEPEELDLGGAEEDLAADVDGDLDIQCSPDDLDSDEDIAFGPNCSIQAERESEVPMHIVPLYSLLPSEKQMKVFETPPENARLVVVATNVAETSLTIPGIRYVVDCGRAKERRYDLKSGIQSFQVTWISKASAAQRAGRAGRTGPGHCYRLYSSALYENYFQEFAMPELFRVPIEGVVLQMKHMNIDIVMNFPFPTPPDRAQLQTAETILHNLGALEGNPPNSHITPLGNAMALFPLSPRFSKMLVSGRQHGCLPFVIAIVSALSVGDPFLRDEMIQSTHGEDHLESQQTGDIDLSHIISDKVLESEASKLRRQAFQRSQEAHATLGNCTSDIFRLLSVIGAYEFANDGKGFCADHFVRPKAMEEIHNLRTQITNIVRTTFPETTIELSLKMSPPDELQLKVLRQLVASGFIDQTAIRKDLVDRSTPSADKYRFCRNVPYRAMGVSEDVFIHPSSVIYSGKPPDFVVYHEIVKTNRNWIKTVTIINPSWLPTLAPNFCTLSKPVKLSMDVTVVIPKFGPDQWELPPIKQ